jgi:hypothetical protein
VGNAEHGFPTLKRDSYLTSKRMFHNCAAPGRTALPYEADSAADAVRRA